jgi:CheY-like chemotaxis protein
MSCRQVRRAIDIYLQYAWGSDPSAAVNQLVDGVRSCHELEVLFELFEPESSETHGDGSGRGGFRRYALRLGNLRYPFMKLIVQEYLVNGEFFFSVDTHDNLDIRADNPDYREWNQLKRSNGELKIAIEAAWDKAGLPTHADLQALMEALAKGERRGQRRARLLLVDDETHVAFGLKALFVARGFEVSLAHDGREALEQLSEGPVPDLLLLDNDMPELDGRHVLAAIRADPRLEDLPVLMTTAAQIDLARLQRVSGFLRKPYPRQVLFEMVDRLVAGRDQHPAGG